MTNAELIATIRNEIERRITDNTFGAKLELIDILAWLDTLESETTYDTQQYTPRPSVSIEDVARVQFASHAKVIDKKRKAVFDWEQFKEVAGIFYGFGKKDRSDTIEPEKPVPADLEEAAKKFAVFYDQGTCDGIAQDCFIAGAKWQKEQMMKEAIGGNAYPNDGEIWVDLARYGYKFKEGEPCRIIIVKED